MNKKIYLCAINNISSGNCSQDCKFCTQSAYNKTIIDNYKYKDINLIVEEAKKAYSLKAIGYCLVTSGLGLTDKSLEYVSKVAHTIKKEVPSLSLIGCNGTASLEQLKELKKNGIDNYNHNLETSKEYYKNICTTHSWEDRYNTAINAKEAQLNLCVGGIFGLGESKEDRDSLIKSISSLKPMSIPINFFIENKDIPINGEKFNLFEAIDIIKSIKLSNPKSMLMVAGGREHTFQKNYKELFESGVNSIVIGDYLTTGGFKAKNDLETINKLGYNIAGSCDE